MTASILQQLLGLYFAIIYSWQLSSSENSLSRKNTFINLMDFTDFFYADIFLNFLWQMSVNLSGYAKRLHPTVLLSRRHLNAMLLI